MKIIYSILLGLFLSSSSFAQTSSDALRFSRIQYASTARTLGINGSINSLGADFSVLSSNPAGMASYRRSEFTFTPTLDFSLTESQLKGNETNLKSSESRSKFALANVGMVFANQPTGSKWATTNFGFGLNRIADFNSTTYYAGKSTGSITDRWVELADGRTSAELDNFEAGPAFDAGAIYNPFAYDETLYGNDFSPNEVVDKAQIIQTTGGISELVFAFAGNYEEKLMIGASVGVPFLNFEENKEYVESDDENNNDVFNKLVYNEYLKTTGTGINLKMGFIYRPFQAFRIGAAFHTPTSFNLEDQFRTTLAYDFGQGEFEGESPDGFFDYKLVTPMKVIGSTSFLFGKRGFLSAEVEWLDYSAASFNFNNSTNLDDQEYEQFINQEINDDFKSTINVRLGGEIAFDVLRIRAGYGILGSPYTDGEFSSGQNISGGIGIRERNFFLDLGYQNTQFGDTYVPFIVAGDNSQSVINDYVEQKFLLTFGFKF